MRHLTHDELVRWRDAAPAAARASVVAHLASCAVCAARCATVVREAPLPATPTLEAREFLAVGRRAIDRSRRPPRRWWWTLVPLAAAAVWAISVIGPAPDAPGTVLRGPEFTGLAPSGRAPAAGFEFRWVAPGAWTRFEVEVFDEASTVVWTARSGGSPVPADGVLLARLRDGRPYRWTVTALDARGQAAVSSPLTTFRLAP